MYPGSSSNTYGEGHRAPHQTKETMADQVVHHLVKVDIMIMVDQAVHHQTMAIQEHQLHPQIMATMVIPMTGIGTILTTVLSNTKGTKDLPVLHHHQLHRVSVKTPE